MKNFCSFKEFSSALLEFINSGQDDSARFNELALALFRLQFENVPAYRALCLKRNANPKHWTEIPAVPTTSFKDFELTSLAPAERTNVFYSSGTTEQRPSRHFHNAESLAIYEASLMCWFAECFKPSPNLRFISLTPPPHAAPNSSLVHMFGTIGTTYQTVFTGNIGDDKAWVVNQEKTTELLQMFCNQNEPVAIVGTAFGFVHLLDHLTASKQHFQLPAGSRVLETGGYKGRSRVIPKNKLHQLIAKQLGVSNVQIISEYGMSELSSQGYDNPQRIFRLPPWAHVQIISPETNKEVAIGETGLVRILDLANVYSVMAIQTEDLAIRRDNGFELLGRATEAEPRGCSLMATAPGLH
jgi:phenylacetate-coenzyme A ligase PaaK-like adenylate-forming protein